MKKITIITLINLICFVSFSQTEITDLEMKKLKSEIDIEANKLRQKLDKEDYISELNESISIDFQVDTFKIESLFSRRLDMDYSTIGMVEAIIDLEKEYDLLLNKYYKILVAKLNETDKGILKNSQRNWIQFRDIERQLNSEISKEEYSGGGTIQQIIVSDKYLNITKNRVLELNDYLFRIN